MPFILTLFCNSSFECMIIIIFLNNLSSQTYIFHICIIFKHYIYIVHESSIVIRYSYLYLLVWTMFPCIVLYFFSGIWVRSNWMSWNSILFFKFLKKLLIVVQNSSIWVSSNLFLKNLSSFCHLVSQSLWKNCLNRLVCVQDNFFICSFDLLNCWRWVDIAQWFLIKAKGS